MLAIVIVLPLLVTVVFTPGAMLITFATGVTGVPFASSDNHVVVPYVGPATQLKLLGPPLTVFTQ